MKRYFLILLFIFISCERDFDHPMIDDPDLNQAPVIANLAVNSDYDVEVTLSHSYSSECSFELIRYSNETDYTGLPYVKNGSTVLKDTTLDKESSAVYY